MMEAAGFGAAPVPRKGRRGQGLEEQQERLDALTVSPLTHGWDELVGYTDDKMRAGGAAERLDALTV